MFESESTTSMSDMLLLISLLDLITTRFFFLKLSLILVPFLSTDTIAVDKLLNI